MVRKFVAGVKEKVLQAVGSLSSITSVFGSWQICHSICLGLVAVLSVVGISVSGLPLFFLNQYALPLWWIAFGFLVITLSAYFWRRCISGKLILFNSGLIIAGMPFSWVKEYTLLLWMIGGMLIAAAIFLYVHEKLERREDEKKK